MPKRATIVATLDEYWKTSAAPTQKQIVYIVDDFQAENRAIEKCMARIESAYPGYMQAYRLLTDVGCDNDYATAIIQYATSQTKKTIMEVLETAQVLVKLDTALVLNMSAGEFINLLSIGTVTESATLPSNVASESM